MSSSIVLQQSSHGLSSHESLSGSSRLECRFAGSAQRICNNPSTSSNIRRSHSLNALPQIPHLDGLVAVHSSRPFGPGGFSHPVNNFNVLNDLPDSCRVNSHRSFFVDHAQNDARSNCAWDVPPASKVLRQHSLSKLHVEPYPSFFTKDDGIWEKIIEESMSPRHGEKSTDGDSPSTPFAPEQVEIKPMLPSDSFKPLFQPLLRPRYARWFNSLWQIGLGLRNNWSQLPTRKSLQPEPETYPDPYVADPEGTTFLLTVFGGLTLCCLISCWAESQGYIERGSTNSMVCTTNNWNYLPGCALF